ncbi:MAG: response regulator transcription factor [Myxococcales bacterium]|jgi:DNA-binding response OmpR family regulator
MAPRRILVVEDDAAIRRGIVDALECRGYAPLEAGTFAEGLRSGLQAPCDLILLDLVLPGGDGLDLLGEVRLARPRLPVIILTARGQEDDRVNGLQLGADDYVVKPFSVKELVARVEAVLRRSAERPLELKEARFAGGVADLEHAEVRFDDGAHVELAEREAALLAYLARSAGRTVTREELLQRVWRLPPNAVRTRTIDMHVARLREKLRDDSSEPRVIATVRGKGYCFRGVP